MLAARQVVIAIKQRLLDANTDAGQRVYAGRGWPLDTLPAIKVFADDEDLAADQGDDIGWPRQCLHSLGVDVECTADDIDDPESAADQLAEQVLYALEGSLAAASLSPLPGVALMSRRISRLMQTEGAAKAAKAVVSFDVLFTTRTDDPSTLI